MNIRLVQKDGREVWVADLAASETTNGKRVRFFAATRAKAVAKAEAHIQLQGTAAAFGPLEPTMRAAAARWSKLLSAEELDEACREYHERKGRGVTAASAAAQYLAAPRETPLSIAHLKPLTTRLTAFCDAFGPRRLADITAGELEDFYRSKGRSSPNYFSAARALFKFAHAREWIAADPFDRLTKPSLERMEDDLLTPEQMAGMLAGAGAALARLLVLGGFYGLRHSECMRLDLADIDRATWEIRVRRMKTRAKGIPERYVQPTEQGKAWLQSLNLPASGPAVPMSEANIRKHRMAACKAIGRTRTRVVTRKGEPVTITVGDWPDNCLRRSLASYWLASKGEAAMLAEMLGHTDASTTKRNYRVARQKAVADAWFAIMPEG